MGAVSKTKEKTCIKGKDLEGLGATTCKDQENKDPNVDVGVLCSKGNDKGRKRQKEGDGMKALVTYVAKQNRQCPHKAVYPLLQPNPVLHKNQILVMVMLDMCRGLNYVVIV